MSSDLKSVLESIVLNDYLSLAVVTAVGYDYILNFSREIEYVWRKPWTWVSTIFVVLRYIGLCWIMTVALTDSTFVPGPPEACTVLYLVFIWGFVVFLSATDLVMILRVYAMWNRSRLILYTLLFIYVLQNISSVILDGVYNNPDTHDSVTVARIVNFSFCINKPVNVPLGLSLSILIPRLFLATTLMSLAVLQTLKQSVEMYRATQQWQPNRYMQKLVKDGILYFIVNVLFQVNDVLIYGTPLRNTSIILNTFIYTAFYTLIPRFIINIRELYDRDIHGRFHIDTGFGVQSWSNAGPDATVSAMVFVEGNQGPEVEDGMSNSGDLQVETGRRVHGPDLNEDIPIRGSVGV
ncbi:hypothetical protein EV363DRAFT_1347193 [Boletus edulis]|uniref:DUF6533 domain-containing protein n=1 Tax=Boletus edulis BED1 TaxID=1328754 RepID=A0AAD4GMJ5_BOLED|nr:hypothetical protein EV363DRAFT_1347193 [Boletus edulis]KAF8452888.1 hypothetical protein L210DRAFT_3519898 [Boletus edulis BED1]